jgi:hypothetical protein
LSPTIQVEMAIIIGLMAWFYLVCISTYCVCTFLLIKLKDTSVVAAQAGLPFPTIPDAATMVNLQMNKYPTFFGCNASADVPLVLYIPNAPWTAYTNYTYTTPRLVELNMSFPNPSSYLHLIMHTYLYSQSKPSY